MKKIIFPIIIFVTTILCSCANEDGTPDGNTYRFDNDSICVILQLKGKDTKLNVFFDKQHSLSIYGNFEYSDDHFVLVLAPTDLKDPAILPLSITIGGKWVGDFDKFYLPSPPFDYNVEGCAKYGMRCYFPDGMVELNKYNGPIMVENGYIIE